VKKLLDELTHLQMEAAEKRRLLELGKFRPATTLPDTTALTEQAQNEPPTRPEQHTTKG
jgi:hypothetical protein